LLGLQSAQSELSRADDRGGVWPLVAWWSQVPLVGVRPWAAHEHHQFSRITSPHMLLIHPKQWIHEISCAAKLSMDQRSMISTSRRHNLWGPQFQSKLSWFMFPHPTVYTIYIHIILYYIFTSLAQLNCR
jgi:hypothetical protein